MTPLERIRALCLRAPSSVTAVFGASSCPAVLEFNGAAWPSEEYAGISTDTLTLTYPYPDLPGLQPGSSLTVDGTAYIVTRGPRRLGDGLEGVVMLEEA